MLFAFVHVQFLNCLVLTERHASIYLSGSLTLTPFHLIIYHQVKIIVLNDNVRIFVLYDNHESAEKAKLSLDTRFFGGRVISGVLYDHDLFLAGNYEA